MVDSLLRVAFINNSATDSVRLHVVTQDKVEYCELLGTTPASTPEQDPGTLCGPGAFDVEVPAGRIFGFVTKAKVDITNPSSSILNVVYANDKDPWPQPPPAAPVRLSDVSDFATRYDHFLLVADGGPHRKHKPVVMTLVPPGLG
jgi:hypothetical protein